MSKAASRVGRGVGRWLKQVGSQLKAAKEKVREYRLFAKTKDVRNRIQKEMVEVVEGLQAGLGQVLEATREGVVEWSIGTAKSARYGFNRPVRRSTEMMGLSGQRAVPGANLTKLLRGLENRTQAEGIA